MPKCRDRCKHDLVRHGVLPDPFYGTNEEKVQWVEDENWDFRKSFTVTAEQLQRDDALLFFEGSTPMPTSS